MSVVRSECRCWAVTRRDGEVLGFTDHDGDLAFDGIGFRANSGLSAGMIEQVTGLAIDNGEATGALTSDAITEADIAAGRFDGAGVRAWLVNWRDVGDRQLVFAGTLGEITRAGGAFRAELRGLSEALGREATPLYQSPCAAVLGDAKCGVDLTDPAMFLDGALVSVADGEFTLADTVGHPAGWFADGRAEVQSGAAKGLSAPIRREEVASGQRRILLWQEFRAALAVGDQVRIFAGCNRKAATCRDKFTNFTNFRGFPHLPGNDWVTAVPRRGGSNDGGSMN